MPMAKVSIAYGFIGSSPSAFEPIDQRAGFRDFLINFSDFGLKSRPLLESSCTLGAFENPDFTLNSTDSSREFIPPLFAFRPFL
jgi:hypothetical protein